MDDRSTTVASEPSGATPPAGDPALEEPPTLKTGPAAKILGVDSRTVERWIDDGKLRGGRARDPFTGKPVKGSHRWADARHVVELTVGANRGDRVPAYLRYLMPRLADTDDSEDSLTVPSRSHSTCGRAGSPTPAAG